MKKIYDFIKQNAIVLALLILTVLASILFQQYYVKEYSRINNSTTDFISAKVVRIDKSELTYNEALQISLGSQTITVKMLEGDRKNEEVTLQNYVTATHNLVVEEGSKIILSADEPEGISPYYTVYNYDGALGLSLSLAVLFLIIILIGKGKGVRAILGLAYTLYFILFLLLPMVFSGYSPVAIAIVCVACSTAVTLLLLNGNTKKTYCAIIATVLGVGISAISFYFISLSLHINGFSLDEAESLVLIANSTNLQIKEVLFASILIASLGAVMDVAMSIVSSLYEIYNHQPDLNMKQLFHSGIEIGKDMIGTMANTLILAFTGSAFVSLLVLYSFQVDFNQLLHSTFIFIEFAQGIAGTLGIVITVPIASWLTAYVLAAYKQKGTSFFSFMPKKKIDTKE